MEAIFKRRSVRRYQDVPISDEDITKLLKAAMRAPSAKNVQPWEFVVMKNRESMIKITEFHPFATMLNNAACTIVVCGNSSLDEEYDFWIQDCSAATENILLEAVHLGIGGVWLGIYPIEERITGMQKLLELPEYIIPLSAVALGYPAKEPKLIDTYLPERVHVEKW